MLEMRDLYCSGLASVGSLKLQYKLKINSTGVHWISVMIIKIAIVGKS